MFYVLQRVLTPFFLLLLQPRLRRRGKAPFPLYVRERKKNRRGKRANLRENCAPHDNSSLAGVSLVSFLIEYLLLTEKFSHVHSGAVA